MNDKDRSSQHRQELHEKQHATNTTQSEAEGGTAAAPVQGADPAPAEPAQTAATGDPIADLIIDQMTAFGAPADVIKAVTEVTTAALAERQKRIDQMDRIEAHLESMALALAPKA